MTLANWVKILGGGRQFFYLADLMKLGKLDYEAARKAAHRLRKAGLLVRVGRELMVNGLWPPRLEMVACLVRRPAYVSLEYALFLHGALDQAPAVVTCVTTGRPGLVAMPVGTALYHRLAPSLFHGFADFEGFLLATPEKALLDHCYLKRRARGVPVALPGDLDPDAFDAAAMAEQGRAFPSAVLQEALRLVQSAPA